MNSRKATLILALFCSSFLRVEGKTSKAQHALGKSIRSKIGKSIENGNVRFAQSDAKNPGFFGDLAAGALSAVTGIPPPGMSPQGIPPQGVPPQNPNEQPAPSIDFGATQAQQDEVEQQLEKTSTEGDKLQESVDMLSKTTGANDRKGVDYSVNVIDPKTTLEIKEEKKLEAAEAKAAEPPLYTAPVIILLPPEPTPIEKLEFARAVACRGKMNTPEMRAIRSAKLAEMATIKGNTVAALQAELKETEAMMQKSKADRQKIHEELRQVESNVAAGAKSNADVLFLKEDLKLADEKIAILLDKLKKIETRIHKLKKTQNEDEKKASGAEEE